jgi:hypothetical protein
MDMFVWLPSEEELVRNGVYIEGTPSRMALHSAKVSNKRFDSVPRHHFPPYPDVPPIRSSYFRQDLFLSCHSRFPTTFRALFALFRSCIASREVIPGPIIHSSAFVLPNIRSRVPIWDASPINYLL